MSEEVQAKRGDAAWKEQRDAIANRNADAQRKGRANQKTRDGVVESRNREQGERERKQLHALNARLGKQQTRRAN